MQRDDDPVDLDAEDRALVARLRALPPEGDEPSWHELNAAIRAQVASEVAPSPWWRSWRWLAPIGLLAATATIALMVVRSSSSETPPEQTALRDAGVVAPIAHEEPPRERAPAVWLDGEPVDIDAIDIDAIELPAELDDDIDDIDVLGYGWIDTVDDAAIENIERWLERQKS